MDDDSAVPYSNIEKAIATIQSGTTNLDDPNLDPEAAPEEVRPGSPSSPLLAQPPQSREQSPPGARSSEGLLAAGSEEGPEVHAHSSKRAGSRGGSFLFRRRRSSSVGSSGADGSGKSGKGGKGGSRFFSFSRRASRGSQSSVSSG